MYLKFLAALHQYKSRSEKQQHINSAKLLRAGFDFPEFCGKHAERNFTKTDSIIYDHGCIISFVLNIVKQHKSSQKMQLKAYSNTGL